MPYALCPMPYIREHRTVTEKGYKLLIIGEIGIFQPQILADEHRGTRMGFDLRLSAFISCFHRRLKKIPITNVE